MGGSSSKASYESLTQIGIDVATSQLQKCSATTAQSQAVNIKGTKGNVSLGNIDQRQSASINMECAFDNETQSAIQTELANRITQEVQAKGGDFTAGFGNSSSEVNTKITNMLNTSISNESVMEAVSSTLQEQSVSVQDTDGNVRVGNISQDQTAENIARIMMTNTQYSDVINEIATQVDQEAKSQGGGIFTNMFDMIGGIADRYLKGFKGIIMSVAIATAVVVVVGILIYVGMKMMQSRSVNATVAAPAYVPRATGFIPPPPL